MYVDDVMEVKEVNQSQAHINEEAGTGSSGRIAADDGSSGGETCWLCRG